MCRTQRVDVEPNVRRPTVFDEMFVLVFVAADVACNVGGLKGYVRVLVEAGPSSDEIWSKEPPSRLLKDVLYYHWQADNETTEVEGKWEMI
eukprot:scaffold9870_cov36-Cyclotella_meneghiniana.AAC.1